MTNTKIKWEEKEHKSPFKKDIGEYWTPTVAGTYLINAGSKGFKTVLLRAVDKIKRRK